MPAGSRPWIVAAVLLACASAAPASAARKPAGKAARPSGKAAPAPKAPAPIPAEWLREATGLDILPASAALDGPRAAQRLVVLATLRDGSTVDVTDGAQLTLSNARVARIRDGVLYPVADGAVRVVARLGRLASPPAEITVRNARAPSGVEFVNDIMPILAKGGCNNTACHGSPAGKAGFKLSLFGYEPELDYVAIVKDAGGKRVDLRQPEKSLLLQKATMQVPHGGGLRFKKDGPEYRTLVAWLKEGAPGIGEFEARVKRVEVIPDQPRIPRANLRQRLIVVAYRSDGSARDVTDQALFSSNDDAIAAVDDAGIVTARRPGETAVMVRYLGQVAVSRVAVLPPWKLERYPEVPRFNLIDELVQARLKKLRMVPSDLCTDEEFVRRVYLDVCGIIPTVEEVRRFLADRSPDKRARLIDQLLERPEYVDLWTMKWNDTLRNNPRLTRLGLGAYARWIREQIAQNRPYDAFVRDLLTASGKVTDVRLDPDNLPRQLERFRSNVERINQMPPNPAANYYLVSRDPLDLAAATSQIFLGVRIECARCHNHPFEKWTQSDFYGLAAFFTNVTAPGGNNALVVLTTPRARPLRHPKTNEPVEPRPLDQAEIRMPDRGDPRVALAEWLTSAQNPWFARAYVNRVWGHYFGRGIVEPIDDFRITNPPSNPELLDALAREFVEHRFDVKHIHRLILNSRTYQQSCRPNSYNRQDTANFARFYPKRMMAEQLYDSISQATGVYLNLPVRRNRLAAAANIQAQAIASALPEEPVTRVMQLPALVPQGGANLLNSPVARFLETFGKPRREVVCECERSYDGNMGQALALINGDINDKIASPRGRVQQLARSARPDPEVIEELYLAALSRRPTQAEMNEAVALVRSARSRAEGLEDLMWGLLNSREFLFIH